MPVPFFQTLSPQLRLIYPQIVRGTRAGMSTRAMETSLRNQGIAVSRSRTLVPLMREIRDSYARGGTVRFVNQNAVINTNNLPESFFRLRRQFSYRLRVEGFLPDGSRGQQMVTVVTDRDNMTPGQLADEAISFFDGEEGYNQLQADRAVLQFGERQGPLELI